MRLAAFIQNHTRQITSDWENFALTLVSEGYNASPLALRDHIEHLLEFIAADIESVQTQSEQKKKARGNKAKHPQPSAAEIHASIRLAGGFNMDDMVSEYRSLRASVIRLWQAQQREPTLQDITDLTRFNEAIDQQLTESIHHYTKKLDYSRDLFLGILSHDLRNPMCAARMSAELALTIGGLTERQIMLVTQVIESSDRALEIVTHLLDLTRARLGSGLPIIRTAMDMGFVARVMVDEMRAMHPARDIQLKITGDMEGEWDKPRIGQVFSNLLGNAIQYGFKDVPIKVTLTAEKECIILCIHNDGVSIPTDTIGRIFDSLTRARKAGTDENSSESINLGLGLYITKEIVHAHSGTIGVTSTDKEGTMFTTRLPRTQRSSIAPAPAQIFTLVAAV